MKRDELANYLNELLETERFKDYCPNGLQVEGRCEISRIVAGVTANQALIDAAIARDADALLVHHGWFWCGEDGRVTGFRKVRMQSLLKHDINLLAYHLPLDAHPQFGNNAELARRLGWTVEGRFGEQDIGWFGTLPEAASLNDLTQAVAQMLERHPLVIGNQNQTIKRIAWCSGGGQNYFEQALVKGVNAFLCGEISEHNVHLARESGTAFIVAGHHATERLGIQALARHLEEKFAVPCEFVDIDNPV